MVLDDDILLFQILPRVPATSLGRFKCVCKQWRSFLTTPTFTKMHLHHVNNQNHHKQLVVPSTRPWKYFRTIDCETPQVGLSSNRSLPFNANGNNFSIIASLDGLVCVGIDLLRDSWGTRSWCRYSDLILWNPLTGDYKTLSKDISHANCFTIPARGYGLYYSRSDDDYKLLRVTESGDAYIYSLKSDSWRKVESASCCLLEYCNSSCFLNENLYFLAQGINKKGIWSYLIIKFDTNTEKFPDMAASSLPYVVMCYLSLTIVSGCVHLCTSSRVDSWHKLDLWKMDGDGELTKVASLCLELDMHEFYKPLHVMKNGNWLVETRSEGYVDEVDLVRKTTKTVRRYSSDEPMDILWRGKFVETIVSLSR